MKYFKLRLEILMFLDLRFLRLLFKCIKLKVFLIIKVLKKYNLASEHNNAKLNIGKFSDTLLSI